MEWRWATGKGDAMVMPAQAEGDDDGQSRINAGPVTACAGMKEEGRGCGSDLI